MHYATQEALMRASAKHGMLLQGWCLRGSGQTGKMSEPRISAQLYPDNCCLMEGQHKACVSGSKLGSLRQLGG